MMNIIKLIGCIIVFLLYRCSFDNVISFGLTCGTVIVAILVSDDVQEYMQKTKALKKRKKIELINRNKKIS